MSYWITTQWPRLRSIPASSPYFGVWVKDSQWHLIDQVNPGDLVFIYEFLGDQPSLKLMNPAGREGCIAKKDGAESWR